jgi:hypothetical protein
MSKPLRQLNVKELKETLQAIAEFLEKMHQIRLNLVDEIVKRMEGKEVAKNTATFYNTLIEAGLPKDTATELTKEYLKRRLELIPKPITVAETPLALTSSASFDALRIATVLALINRSKNILARDIEEEYS